MRVAIYILLFLCYSFAVEAQCSAIKPFSVKAMDEITDIYQLTFLHKDPKNKLDSLVKQAMYPALVIDSALFDWKKDGTKPVKSIDRIKFARVVDEIGKLKTKEAFLILNLQHMLPFKMQDDMTLYATFCNNVAYFGAIDAINKYFLNNAISTKLARPEFENKVMVKAIALREQYFKGITYCKPLVGEARVLYEMQQFNVNPYDSVIEKTITKYLNLYPNIPSYFNHDSILLEVVQLPFVHDAQLDNCVQKAVSDEYPPPLQLGVIIHVGQDEFNQKKFIQRVYGIGRDQQRNSILLPTRYDADFVSRTRRQCEGIDEEIYLDANK